MSGFGQTGAGGGGAAAAFAASAAPPAAPSCAAEAAVAAAAVARAQRVATRDAARVAAAAAAAEAARLAAASQAADAEAILAGEGSGDDAGAAPDAEEAALVARLAAVRAARQAQAAASARMAPPGGASALSPASCAVSAHGPKPKAPYQDKYKGDGGIALDGWIGSATIAREFFSGMDDAGAVSWLAPALDGAALDWLISHREQHGRLPVSPAALFAGLRSRFQPVNAKETARRELDALRQNKETVNDYTTKFRRLIALLPGETEDSRMYQFRRGLTRGIEDRIMQAEPQPASLEATIALASRIEGRWRSSHASAESTAQISLETENPAQLSALVDAAVRRGLQEAAYSSRNSREGEQSTQPRYDSRQTRGANKRAGGKSMAQHFGLSEEVTRTRFDGGLCMHCGVTGHIRRECPDFKAGKPPRLN